MITPGDVDVQKLNFIKGRIKVRPANKSFTQPLSKRTVKIAAHNSSEEVNQSNNHKNPIPSKQTPTSTPRNTEVSKRTIDEEENIDPDQPDDCISVTSSEWGGDDHTIEKEKLKKHRRQHSSDRKYTFVKSHFRPSYPSLSFISNS
jgi:hypothetical protein